MIDWTNPIETVDGREARRLIGPVNAEFHCVYTLPDPESCGSKHDVFLVDNKGVRCDDRAIYSARQGPFIRNVKVKKEGWQTIHRTRHGKYTGSILYESEELAHKAGSQFSDYVATVKIKWEE